MPQVVDASVSSKTEEATSSHAQSQDSAGFSKIAPPRIPASIASSPAPVSGARTPATSQTPPTPDVQSGAIPSPLPKVCPNCHARYPADFRVCPRDAAPLEDAADEEHDPLLGTILGDTYEIVRVIGEGGMGRVYEARHTRLANMRFAIKMLHAEYSRQAEVVARFQREAEAASGIAHPNVVGVYDVHRTADGRPYLVAEFLEGEELGDHLHRRGRIPPALAVRIVRQVCRALGAAHARGVVHRDMKPENVFLVGDPENPTVKVIDFGISKVGDATGTALTRTGMIMGTPSYMAPEQARGEKVDPRADIYAVGGILYRALTGRKPFDSDDPSTILTQVLTEDPMRPRSLDATIPEALEIVIQRAMAKSPADRPPTMAALEAELVPFDTVPAALPPDPCSVGVSATSADAERVEPGARTVLAVPTATPPSQTQFVRATREAKRARPMIALLTFIGYLWVVAGLIDALTGTVRLLRPSTANITRTEALLISLGAAAATLTPLVLWIRHLARGWGNSVRAMNLADQMRLVITVSIATSGIGSLMVRIVDGALRAEAADIARPMWSPILFLAAVIAGVLAYLPGRRASKA